jgi:hypothetical protein
MYAASMSMPVTRIFLASSSAALARSALPVPIPTSRSRAPDGSRSSTSRYQPAVSPTIAAS